MNLLWNPTERRFEAQFHDFASEQPLVKKVGFRTDGPPAWVWYSVKAEPLAKLRENRPAILTITPEARAEYTRLHDQELKHAEMKAKLKAAAKELKKKLKQDAVSAEEYFDQELGFVCLKVAPKQMPRIQSFDRINRNLTSDKCIICGSNLYAYEWDPAGPRVCLWCQKIVLDNSEVL